MSSKTENKPVDKIRVGSVQVSIWCNEGEKGPYYKAEIEHSYKDRDGNWHRTTNYGRHELINLAKAALLADSKIGELARRNSGKAGDDHEQDEAV